MNICESTQTTEASSKHFSLVRVAIGLICDEYGRYLIAKRPRGTSFSGFWEFPGGKCEDHENDADALVRELEEEVGICARSVRRYYHFSYFTKTLHIVVSCYEVLSWSGTLKGCEGQEIRFVPPQMLRYFNHIPHNLGLVKKIGLPAYYGIVNCEDMTIAQLKKRLTTISKACVSDQKDAPLRNVLVQLRFKFFGADRIKQYLHELKSIDGNRILNAHALQHSVLNHSLHLNSEKLMQQERRPISKSLLCGASCHNIFQLEKAVALDLDYVLLSPVNSTPSHPHETRVLGWRRLALLTKDYPIPVYALGGLSWRDLNTAQDHGAHGVGLCSEFSRIF